MNEINIGFTFDRNYVTPFYVLITSIFFNNKTHALHLHVLSNDLSEREKKLMEEYVGLSHGRISFYSIDPSLLENLSIHGDTHFSVAIYYRLFLPLILPPEVKRFLYLDTDTLVIADLSSLFEIDLSGNAMAAAVDRAMPVRTDLGKISRDEYFNSGVLLIDIQEWKAQKITERALHYVLENRDNQELIYGDQDALNTASHQRWNTLDRRYNIMPFDVRKANFQSEDDYLKDKVILHYAGHPKPWGLRSLMLKKIYDFFYDAFANSTIGQVVIPADFERSFKDLIPSEPSFGIWTPEELLQWAFCLQLILLQEVSNNFRLRIPHQWLKGENNLVGSKRPTIKIYKESFFHLRNAILNHSKKAESGIPMWLDGWRGLCRQELKKRINREPDGAGMCDSVALTEISNYINEKLMLTTPMKSRLLFYLREALIQNKSHKEHLRDKVG